MAKYVNDLGTSLFKSVANKAGDLGDKFGDEFSYLAQNITRDVNDLVEEVISLSPFIKVALVSLSIFLVLLSIRLVAYGIRIIVNKRRRYLWMNMLHKEALPPVVLMLPSPDGTYSNSRILPEEFYKRLLMEVPFSDPQKTALLGELQMKKNGTLSVV